MNIFNVSIVSSEKVIYEGEAVSLTVPGQDGFLGILANHAPLIANLKSGDIVLRKNLTEKPFVFHSQGKGFLEVSKNKASLLLE